MLKMTSCKIVLHTRFMLFVCVVKTRDSRVFVFVTEQISAWPTVIIAANCFWRMAIRLMIMHPPCKVWLQKVERFGVFHGQSRNTRTDRQTDRQTDGHTDIVILIYRRPPPHPLPPTVLRGRGGGEDTNGGVITPTYSTAFHTSKARAFNQSCVHAVNQQIVIRDGN